MSYGKLIVPTWRLHSELCKFPWNVSANNSRTVHRTDLRLGDVVYLRLFLKENLNHWKSAKNFRFTRISRLSIVSWGEGSWQLLDQFVDWWEGGGEGYCNKIFQILDYLHVLHRLFVKRQVANDRMLLFLKPWNSLILTCVFHLRSTLISVDNRQEFSRNQTSFFYFLAKRELKPLNIFRLRDSNVLILKISREFIDRNNTLLVP